MKEKNKLKQKNNIKGITLIALVVTIIALLVLAGVTIITLTGEDGILKRVEEAKFKTELSRLQEELEIYKATKISETQGEFVETSLSANKLWLYYDPVKYVENGTIEEVMPSISEEMKNKIEVLNGDIMFSGSETEVAWAKELGINKIVKIENGVLLSDDDNLSILSENGTFTVPSSVDTIGEGAFAQVKGVRKVIIPYTVKEVAQNAFRGNSSIEEVVFETKKVNEELKGVVKIGDSAFRECTALAKLELPDTLSNVSSYIFYKCANLDNVTIPNSLISIGYGMFAECTNLRTIILPNTLTEIGYYAFSVCSNLKNIDFPDSLVYVRDSAFEQSGLQEARFGDSLTTIGGGAFKSCTELKNIYLGELVKDIGVNAFIKCQNLTNIEISNKNTNLKFLSGILLNGDGSKILYILPSTISETTTEFSVPKGVKELTGSFGQQFPQVTSLKIPSSVNNIDIENFLTNITQIEVDSENETYLSENNNLYSKDKKTLYYYLENKETVSLNTEVTTVKSNAFASKSLTNVETVNLNGNITTLENALFGVRIPTNLKKIYIGENVENLVYNSLPMGVNIEIVSSNNYYSYEDEILYNKEKSRIIRCLKKDVGNFVVPQSVSIIGYQSFVTSSIKKIELTNNVTSIEESAFYRASLSEIKWSNNLTQLGKAAFLGTSLVSVELPNGVTSIGNGCFQDCQQLQNIKIPNSVETIGSGCFTNCPKLIDVKIDKKKGEITGSPWGLIIGERGINWLR